MTEKPFRFYFRAVALILHDGRVLLEKSSYEDFYSLPGGRVEPMEPTPQTVVREMREELGLETKVERLLWVIENFFEYEGEHVQELGFYYLVSLPPDAYITGKDDFACIDPVSTAYIRFSWCALESLPDTRLFPAFLTEAILDLPDHAEHIVHFAKSLTGALPDDRPN